MNSSKTNWFWVTEMSKIFLSDQVIKWWGVFASFQKQKTNNPKSEKRNNANRIALKKIWILLMAYWFWLPEMSKIMLFRLDLEVWTNKLEVGRNQKLAKWIQTNRQKLLSWQQHIADLSWGVRVKGMSWEPVKVHTLETNKFIFTKFCKQLR